MRPPNGVLNGLIKLITPALEGIGKRIKKERDISFKDQYRILVPSREPSDKKYVEFINSLDLGIAMVDKDALKPIGTDFGFTKI